MKFLKISFVIVAIASLTACRNLSAEQKAEWAAKKISYELKLNDEQKTKLNSITQAFTELKSERENNRNKALEETKQILLMEKFDPARAKTLVTQRQKNFSDAFDNLLPKITEFHNSLNSDQKKKAVELLEDYSKYWN